MPQLAGNPLDWFLLHCAVRWLVRWYLVLQRQEAQLHRLEIVKTRFPSSVPCFYGFCCLMYPFFWNLQICCETFNVDCKMFASLHLVLCNMRASQLIFWDLAVQTLSASQAGWEGCFPNCIFPHFVQILERAWICWWTSECWHFVLCFLSLICSRFQERPHAPNRCCQLHCPWPASLWNCTCISLHGKVQTVFWVEQRRKPPV